MFKEIRRRLESGTISSSEAFEIIKKSFNDRIILKSQRKASTKLSEATSTVSSVTAARYIENSRILKLKLDLEWTFKNSWNSII